MGFKDMLKGMGDKLEKKKAALDPKSVCADCGHAHYKRFSKTCMNHECNCKVKM